MDKYTQELIDGLITCPKQIIEPPLKEMRSQRGYLRNGMKLKSRSDDLYFNVFIRINKNFNENFSIGLDYLPVDERGNICLLTYNGPHGGFIDKSGIPEWHSRYHIHKVGPDILNEGGKRCKLTEITTDYASYVQALLLFIKRVNIIDSTEYFDRLGQGIIEFPEMKN